MAVEQGCMLGITLLTPAMAAWGAAAISIPIIIHLLFRRRRRTIGWAAMRFVNQAWAARRRRIRFEQIMLLLVRCAIPVLLGIALAQPVLDGGAWFDSSPTHRYIIVDDGISSSTTDAGGRADLERSLDLVDAYLETTDPGDPISILTTSNNRITNPTTSVDEIRRFCESLEPTQFPSDIGRSLGVVSTRI